MRSRQPDRVADVIGMAVGEDDGIQLGKPVLPAFGTIRVPGQKGIDQDRLCVGLDMHGRMAEPGYSHIRSSSSKARSSSAFRAM